NKLRISDTKQLIPQSKRLKSSPNGTRLVFSQNYFFIYTILENIPHLSNCIVHYNRINRINQLLKNLSKFYIRFPHIEFLLVLVTFLNVLIIRKGRARFK